MVKKYLIKTLNSMATGLFASLIIGVILEQAGLALNWTLLVHLGQVAKLLMGPAIGISVASSVQAPPLVVFASAVTGALGAGTFQSIVGAATIARIGEPVGAFVAALAGAELSRRVAGRTPVDIIIVPATTIIVGGIVGFTMAPAISSFMTGLGDLINRATTLQPVPMGIIVSVVMGMVLTLPISSAAIAISLGLSGLAAGAATVGCCAQMIGFAVISFKENKWSGLLGQGLGTSMLQIPNIIENPRIWIPPTLAAAILGPLATVVFKMESSPVGAGMGTSGLVGQIATIATMGSQSIPSIILLHFILPALLSIGFAKMLQKRGWIKPGDMTLKI